MMAVERVMGVKEKGRLESAGAPTAKTATEHTSSPKPPLTTRALKLIEGAVGSLRALKESVWRLRPRSCVGVPVAEDAGGGV